jgi:hypothetical protein
VSEVVTQVLADIEADGRFRPRIPEPPVATAAAGRRAKVDA